MNSLVVNLVVAVMWLLLSREPAVVDFVIGFVIGFLFLAMFRPVLWSGEYVRRCLGFLKFVAVFSKELFLANLNVARTVLFRSRESLHPNFITYDVTGLRLSEILLLGYCITLTPGTTTVQLSEDGKTLVVHALDAQEPDEVRRQIDRTLRRAILGFTR